MSRGGHNLWRPLRPLLVRYQTAHTVSEFLLQEQSRAARSLLRFQLLLGNRALWAPCCWVRLIVDHTVEYAPQYGNHPGSVGFGVASGHE
jgi:hypothetical protein